MRYIRIDKVDRDSGGGYFLDAEVYLRKLPELMKTLPPGARRFASDEDHYNFFGLRCVKDLTVDSVHIRDQSDRVSIELRFSSNKFKHNQDLVIQYDDVVHFSADVVAAPRTKYVYINSRRLGDVQLDEVLPHPAGCSHEIQTTGGTILVVAQDLHAVWHDLSSEATVAE